MRKFITTVGIAGASFALIAGTAVSASAADVVNSGSAGTLTTVVLEGGSLTLTVPNTATWVNQDLATGAGTTTVGGSLGTFQLIDDRGSNAAWKVTASSSTFKNAQGGPVSDGVSYTTGAVTESSAGVTVADGLTPTVLALPVGDATTGAPSDVVSPTVVSGNNTANWTPVLAVTIPSGALAGTYQGTVTTSLV